MVTVVINTPLNVDSGAGGISDDRCATPTVRGSIIVDADTSVVAARTASANGSNSEIRPRLDRLKDRALRTCVYTRL